MRTSRYSLQGSSDSRLPCRSRNGNTITWSPIPGNRTFWITTLTRCDDWEGFDRGGSSRARRRAIFIPLDNARTGAAAADGLEDRVGFPSGGNRGQVAGLVSPPFDWAVIGCQASTERTLADEANLSERLRTTPRGFEDRGFTSTGVRRCPRQTEPRFTNPPPSAVVRCYAQSWLSDWLSEPPSPAMRVRSCLT